MNKYEINVAMIENEDKYVMYVALDSEEVAEMEISKEYYEASLKEFNE